MQTNTNTSILVVKKPSILVKLYLLPPFIKLLLAVALFFIICILGFSFMKQQSTKEYATIKQKKEILEKEVVHGAQSYGQLSYLAKNTALIKQQYTDMIKKFPPESQIGDLLASITKLGTAEKLKFVSFTPMTAVTYGYYAGTPVQISVTGHFHQLARFLSGIANLPGSVVVVNPLSLTQTEQKEVLLSLQFTATLYYVLPTSTDLNV